MSSYICDVTELGVGRGVEQHSIMGCFHHTGTTDTNNLKDMDENKNIIKELKSDVLVSWNVLTSSTLASNQTSEGPVMD